MQPSKAYPSHAEYDLAIRYLDRFVLDPLLKSGTARSRSGVAVQQGGAPLSYPGGFAKVYILDCGSKAYALRVWLIEIHDAARRYQATTEFLERHKLPIFVDFGFIANGILVQGQRYPLLRMEWFDGETLAEFIQGKLNQPALLRAAADAFAA